MANATKDNLIDRINLAWPPDRWVGFNVLVAVSGGADSIALLRALDEIKRINHRDSQGLLMVANYNHRLRGKESDGDTEFIRQLAAELGREFHGGSADPSERLNSENALRDERYDFLMSVARKTNCRYIVTAHHREDQVETVLFRLFRGTGVGGLGGIPQARVVDESLTIIRPMLRATKLEIESALADWGQSWRTDASNSDSIYARNFIRNEILPMIRQRFENVDESVARLSQQASEQHCFLGTQTQELFQAVSDKGEKVMIQCGPLRDCSKVLLRELFIEVLRRKSWLDAQLGFRELERLACLITSDADQPRFQLPGAISCQKLDGIIQLSAG